SVEVRTRRPESQPVLAVAGLMLRREACRERLSREVIVGERIQRALNAREHQANTAAASAKVALQASGGVQRPRFHHVASTGWIHRALLFAGDGGQRRERHMLAEPRG